MNLKHNMSLSFPIIRCYDDPDDEDIFYIEGLASDTSIDAREGRMDPAAISTMYESAMRGGITVDIEHSGDWTDQIGDVVEAKILNTVPDDAAFAGAEPPLLWAKLAIDKVLSHGKDLYHKLVKKKEQLGLSIEGYVRDYVIDKNGIIIRLDVVWTKLAITANPANRNAWISEVALSINTDRDAEAVKGGLVVIANALDVTLPDVAGMGVPDIIQDIVGSIQNQQNGGDHMSEDYEALSGQVEELAESLTQLSSVVQQLIDQQPESEPEPEGEENAPAWVEQLFERLDGVTEAVREQTAANAEVQQEQQQQAVDLVALLTQAGMRPTPQRGISMSASVGGEGNEGAPDYMQHAESNVDAARRGLWAAVDQTLGR